MTQPATDDIAFIGFGEAAQAFLRGWTEAGGRPARVAAFDVKTDDPATAADMRARYAERGVEGAASPADALAGAAAVFCVVTADRAVEAAQTGAAALSQGAFWFDCNSCSPGAKRRAAEAVEAAGGRYVDVAVMAPVHPRLHHVPLLVAGPHAEAAAETLRALDMRPAVAGDQVGGASAIKMIRSVMIKGFEALTAECFMAAERAGVRAEVLGALQTSDPGFNFPARAEYNLERMMVHGIRRAAEMREVAATLAELGLPNRMASATADWQDEIGTRRLDPGPDDLPARLAILLDGA